MCKRFMNIKETGKYEAENTHGNFKFKIKVDI